MDTHQLEPHAFITSICAHPVLGSPCMYRALYSLRTNTGQNHMYLPLYFICARSCARLTHRALYSPYIHIHTRVKPAATSQCTGTHFTCAFTHATIPPSWRSLNTHTCVHTPCNTHYVSRHAPSPTFPPLTPPQSRHYHEEGTGAR